MAKGFSKNNPLDKLSGTSVPKSTEVQKEPPAAVEPKQTEPEPKQEKPQTTQKRKVGRPKTKDIKNTCKNINVAVPITLLDKWEDIKIVHGSNLTEYITKLIEKDMNANYEHYKDIADSLKNI
jgi:hypothetical protein